MPGARAIAGDQNGRLHWYFHQRLHSSANGRSACDDAFAGTGNAFSIAANRLSYFYDFHGPSIAIDAACSSSLTATHLALQSLRSGESDLSLAGGVSLILSPEIAISLAKLGL